MIAHKTSQNCSSERYSSGTRTVPKVVENNTFASPFWSTVKKSWDFTGCKKVAIPTSEESLRPNPNEPRPVLAFSSFLVRTFMLELYGSKTLRIFITSSFFSWSRLIVAATSSSPENPEGNKWANTVTSRGTFRFSRVSYLLAGRSLMPPLHLWFLWQPLLFLSPPGPGCLNNL